MDNVKYYYSHSNTREKSYHNIYNTIEEQINFFKLLKEKLFVNNLKAANNKEHIKKIKVPEPKYLALKKKFIWYGTKYATNFIIIDIDNNSSTLKKYKEELFYIFGKDFMPNWITKTDNGFQVGYIIKKPYFYDSFNEDDKQYFRFIKEYLTILLQGDKNGSIRAKGWWRNPLMHESIVHDNTFELKKLYKKISYLFEINWSLFDSKKEIENKIIQRKNILTNKEYAQNTNNEKIKKGFIIGNRNDFLFSKTIGLLYSGKIKQDEILSTLQQLNKSFKNTPPLHQEEINRIFKSLIKYNIKPINSKYQKNLETYKKGPYWEDMKNYHIHNFKYKNKMIFQRQQLGQKITTIKRVNNTIQKLIKAYANIYKNHDKFTNDNIQTQSDNISKRTIQRYRKNNMEKKIKNAAFKVYLLKLTDNCVIANVTPVKNQLLQIMKFFIKVIKFECKRTKNIFEFEIDENLNVLFQIRQEISY